MLDRVVNHHSPPVAKIALFRDLFRGREDVYPRRFESRRTGKYGYQPACANEWIRDLCDKRRVKCVEGRRSAMQTDHPDAAHLRHHDDISKRESRLDSEDVGAFVAEDDHGQVFFLYPEHDPQ
jgi:hypothetical protein